ncbi:MULTISPECIES: hypothetical protein [unclassified Streptomyces]|uniref:hypothetical protein n=1 Tax=unclassified Streptomyces TaxID=2593676 RepID=UPI001874AD12|nr:MULTISPECIES: hypothetical protein [unclassified Streptomyces]
MDDRVGRRSGYALTIPDALLHSEAMRRACAIRDFQEIFRLVNRRTGSSYAVIASAVGNMTSSRVSDIIRGVRGIRGQAVIERVADGFGIPGEMLGLPQRSWESSLVEGGRNLPQTYPDPHQETADDPHVLPVDGDSSDVVLVSVWIEGRRQVMPIDRRTLIGGAIGTVLPKMDANRVEAATEHLREMWHSLVRADNLFGPRHALTSVHQQLSILESMLEHARGGQRIGLLRLAAQYAESAAWLHEDTADMPNAVKWTSRAMEWATESGDQSMVMWTLFRKSQQATTRKNPAQTVSLAQAVQRNESVLTPSVRAAAMQQEAHGYALDGDELSCHRRLEEAHEFAASPDTRGDAKSGHGDFCTASYIEIQRANCWITLGRLDLAVPIFEAALDELPDAYQRDRGLAQSRLALAYTGVQEYDQAAAQAASALSIAQASGSMRTMRETVTAVNALGRVHTSQTVTELFDAIEEGTGF